ncbi:MAG: glycosyltransferase family 4 protein, partial [Planctomycetota bacterium]
TDVFARGGIQRYSRHQVRALRELHGDAKLSVLSLLPPAEHGFEDPVEVEAWHGSTHRWLRNWRYTWRALRLARGKWFDLVLCNHVSLAPVALLIKRLLGTPYCVNTYGMEVWSGLSRARMAGLRHADAIFPDCRFTRDHLVHELKLTPEKITVLEDCVDTELFAPASASAATRARWRLPAGTKTLITVSRLVSGAQYKGHECVMRAIRDHCRDLPLAYLIVGDGDDRARLEALAGEWGLRDVCRFTGAVADAELVDLYRVSDLGILISERGPGKGEGIPLALLEASACAKPIIAGHYDGSAEAVAPGVSGLVVDSLDVPAVARAIRAIVTDEALAQRMGRAGRQRIESTFSYRQFRDRLACYLEQAWSVRKYAAAPLTLRRS